MATEQIRKSTLDPAGPSPRGFPLAFGFVVVVGIEVDGSEEPQDVCLLAMTHVFLEGCGDRLFLGAVPAGGPCLLNQLVV